MEEALDDLPKSLEAMYADVLMNKIREEYREEAKVMLMWLAYSYRPVTLRELASVGSLPEQNVLEICTSSFVVLSRARTEKVLDGDVFDSRERPGEWSDHEDFVKFDHFSVKEYLVSERHSTSSTITASLFYVPPMLAHLRMASICISTLLDPKLVDIIEKRIRCDPDWSTDVYERWRLDSGEDSVHTIFPLLGYSQDWHLHVQEADSISVRSAQPNDGLISEGEKLRDQIHNLFCDENQQAFKAWAHDKESSNSKNRMLQRAEYANERFYKWSPTPVLYASMLNLPDSVRRLLKPKFDGRENMDWIPTGSNESEEYGTALQIAGTAGNLEIVGLLLDSGIRIDQSVFENMIEHSERDQIPVMTSIMKVQPDLCITDDTIKAAARNYQTKEFVKCLLNNGFVLSKARLLLVLRHWEQAIPEANNALIKALVKHGEDIGCTRHDFFNVYVQGYNFLLEEQSDREVMLERYEPLSLSQDITECLAAGTFSGNTMLCHLCQKYKDISFSQDLLAAAVSSVDDTYLVYSILEYDKTLNISQLVLQAAARSSFGDRTLFAMMHHNKSLEITWDFLKSTVSTNMMKVLMNHEDCGFRDDDDMRITTTDFDSLDRHGDHEDCKIKCSEQMLQAAARWEPDAIDYFQSHARPNVTFTKYALQD